MAKHMPKNASVAPHSKADTKIDSGHARNIGSGFLIKLVLMAILNALGLYGIWVAYLVESWVIVAIMILALIAINYIYFSKRALPLKYLAPGMAFLLVYQLFVMGYTGYIAFTNYGSGHNTNKEDAIVQIMAQHEKRVTGSPSLPAAVVERNGKLGLAIVKDGSIYAGDMRNPLEKIAGAKGSASGIESVPGWKILDLADIQNRQKEVTDLRVRSGGENSTEAYRTEDGSNAYMTKSIFKFDKKKNVLINTTNNTEYVDKGDGVFTAPDGTKLFPGWRVTVGLDNFKQMFTSSDLGKPFLKSLVWTFCFAALSVLTTFALGLFLAIVFNDPRLRGQRIYRSLLILPYAFPAFLTALVWRGMMNESYGFINEVLLGGAQTPWLSDPWLAKFSILFVNLWLGFPYMFLICTGALQSLPSDVMEAARMDGASAFHRFRHITLPLVLVSTAPLLIASFAFNFNNFSLIYMLTGGGPNYPGSALPIGETDILISMVYAIAFEGGTQRYGLAAAMSIVIFIMVGLISWLGFRQTRKLEEMI